MSKNLKIGILIVTYNRKNLLEECIQAILGQSIHSFSLYVVDNASTDGTEELVKNLSNFDKRIYYLNTGKNLGGAGGFSFGMKYLMGKGYDRLWIMDDDTIPNSNALEELLKADFYLCGHYGFLSSYVEWTDGKYCLMNRPQINDNWIEELAHIDKGLLSIKRATFVSLFLNSTTVIKFGFPIKEFFIWGDDWEYTDRISNEEKSFLVIHSKVTHKTKDNVGSDISSDNNERIARYFYSFRNELYLSKRNGLLSILYYFYRVAGTINAILKSNVSKKAKRISTVIRGTVQGLFFHPTIEYFTEEIKK